MHIKSPTKFRLGFFKISIFQRRERSRGWKCITVPNFVEIAHDRTVAEICEFQYYASLAWKCLFTPLFGFFFGGHISPNDVSHRPNPQKDHPWAEPRHLSHKPRIFSYWFLWALQESSISHWFIITGPPEMVFGVLNMVRVNISNLSSL